MLPLPPPPVDPILLSGPSITHREIECVADAAGTGWNMNCASYIRIFQQQMIAYSGHKYAFPTSSCTGAMHLALLALGVCPGDEVLVPEIADFSVAACVVYTGATPVFCDVDPHTLCLSPASAAANVTPRTKAMVPVHMYGQPCDMQALLTLAQQHKLFVIENATQGLGSQYRGRRVGSFGHFSVFSFNGTKAVVAGEGGILLASDKELFKRAVKLGSQGRNETNPFLYDTIGYNYTMSNVQAALVSAQLERLGDLMEKKRQVFGWYQERLRDVPGIRLNAQRPDSKNCFWMTTLFFDDASMVRHNFMQRLAVSGVTCRPVFYPLSSMPMFTKANNPVAYSVGLRGIVLPCGHNRTVEEVEYICEVIKYLLANKTAPAANVQPTGWLQYKAEVLELFEKGKSTGLSLPFEHDGKACALRAVTRSDIKKPEVLALFKTLRADNPQAFLSDFPITNESMTEALTQYAYKTRDFILFLVMYGDEMMGHVGVNDFAFQKHECVIDGLVMRPDAVKGLGAAACETLFAWAKDTLKITRIYNHVVGSNHKVRLLAAAQGFKEVNKTSLYRTEVEGNRVYRPMYIMGHDKPDEYFVFSAKDL